jgi:hypothetical protein
VHVSIAISKHSSKQPREFVEIKVDLPMTLVRTSKLFSSSFSVESSRFFGSEQRDWRRRSASL